MTDLVETAETPSSAAQPGRAPSDSDQDSHRTLLAAVRREAATLRGVLDAIQEALGAALERLEGLEGHVNGELSLANGAAAPELTANPHISPRPVAEWKLPGWSPAGESDVVTGDTLRARRESLGISQAAVAHAAHCSRGLVAEVERGKRRSAQTLAHLSAVLDRLEQQARRN